MNNQTLNEINNRDLDNCYFSLSFSFSTIYFNDGNDYIYKRKVYSLIGCNILGVRKYITSIFADDYQQASDWYDFFLTLKSRGLETIFFAVIPDVEPLKKAIILAFPETKTFISCFDLIDKLYKFFSQSYSVNFLEYIKRIFISQDINEFNLKSEEFYLEFGNYPFIIDIVKKQFDQVKLHFNLDFLLRKHIYSFYFNREFYKKLAVLSHSSNYFYKLSDFEELLIPIIKVMESKMYAPKREWNQVINSIYNYNKDLIMRYL